MPGGDRREAADAQTALALQEAAQGDSAGRVPLALLGCWLVVTTVWWALALAPVAEPPAWLEAARQVCFGTTLSGLPDTYGWVVLIAAPGTMLIAIAVTWQRELASSLASLARSSAGRLALAGVALFVVSGVAAASMRIADGLAVENIPYGPGQLGSLPDDYPRLNRAVPELVLVDQEGRAFSRNDLAGRVTLVTFAFAHCQTVCPAIVQTMRSVASRLGDDAPEIAVLTLDPWRDTPSRLPSMHADWQMPRVVRVLSGEVDDVTAALDGFDVPWTRDEATGDVVHPALVYAIDRQGRIAYGFNNPSVDWLAEAAERLSQDKVETAGR